MYLSKKTTDSEKQYTSIPVVFVLISINMFWIQFHIVIKYQYMETIIDT